MKPPVRLRLLIVPMKILPIVLNTVATGQNYAADTAGQFRVVLKYPGGCQSIVLF
jgi:hypothetical protein